MSQSTALFADIFWSKLRMVITTIETHKFLSFSNVVSGLPLSVEVEHFPSPIGRSFFVLSLAAVRRTLRPGNVSYEINWKDILLTSGH